MTAPADQLADQFIDLAKRSQEAAAGVTRAWFDSLQSITGTVLPGGALPTGTVPDIQSFVDGYFDVANRLLAGQRELALQVVEAATRTTSAVAEQAAQQARVVAEQGANGVATR